MEIIDADGHIMERGSADEIGKYMPKGSQYSQIFPALDHHHGFHLREERPGVGGGAGLASFNVQVWEDFLDKTGIQWSVLYPTAGLAVGRITSEDWAVAACRAYNSWLYDRYLDGHPRLRGVALIPVQDPQAAAEELRRAVKELGMVAAMLPSNGEGLKAHLGSKTYWPIYEEAEKLGCALAVHGGSHHHLGMDTYSVYYPVNALGHPFGIMVQAAGMITHGIFDRFPDLRVGFLEGGAAWVPFFLDRLDRAYSQSHYQVDLQGEHVKGPNPSEKPGDYFIRKVREGRIFVGFDVDDEGLGPAVDRAGMEPFLYATDFPHEGHDAEMCLGELNELLAREDISEQAKEAVLSHNAKRFYGVDR